MRAPTVRAMPSPARKTPPTLPDGIEIFRAGVREDTNGVVHNISAADLAAAAAAYDPAVHEAPIVVGHPKDDGPAYGWVRKLRADGGSLLSDHHQVDAAFSEMAGAGRFKKRSAAFYQPNDPANPKPGVWYLRHVAWLGAQPPAVKGLREVHFSEGDVEDRAVCFSEPIVTTQQEPDDMSKDLQDQLAKAQADLAAAEAEKVALQAAAAKADKEAADAKSQAAQFAERARADRRNGFVAFATAQVQAGKLLPKDKDMAVAAMEAMADAAPVEFAEGDTTRKVSHVAWLQDLISNAQPSVDFAERGGGALPLHSAKGQSDDAVDRAAQAYATQHNVDYVQALRIVTR